MTGRFWLYCLKQAAQAIARSPWVQLIAITTITMSLTVLSVLLVLSTNLQNLTENWNRGLGLVVFLSDDSDANTLEQVAKNIEGWDEVQSVDRFSREDAYQDLTRSLGDDATLLDGLDVGVLPASVQIVLKPEHRTETERAALAERIQALDEGFEIERVDYGQDMVGRTQGMRELIRFGGLAVGLLVLLAVIFIITNTVRLTLFSRRDEIEVMQLVGAKNSFIRIPFYLEGAFQGGLGAVLAIILTRMSLSAIPVHTIVGDMSSVLPEFQFLSTNTIVTLVLGAAFMGVIASHLATGRFLRNSGE